MKIRPEDHPVALLSGATGGIGEALVRHLLDGGYRVSLGARAPERLRELYGEENGSRHYGAFDAFDKATAERWVEETVERFDGIDVLINCAGLAERVTLFDDDDEALDRLWAVNAKAPLRLTRLCLPHLEKSGHGRIVNIASLAGKRVKQSAIGYAMSKHAMMALTHGTRTLTWDKGIRATAICSGWVRTEMALRAKTRSVPPESMTQPETLAELIRTIIELPNNAAIAELLVNCEFEDLF